MRPEVRKGLFFRRARQRAERYLQEPEKLRGLVERASRKASERVSALDPLRERLAACFRLIKAYGQGRYRTIPWNSVLILVAAVVYFVMPIDAVPDFILGLGLLDDAALLGWALKTFQSDIDVFLAWEREQEEQP
ncbi:YkvA family protein [Haliea atlantica]